MDRWLGSLPDKADNCPEEGDLVIKLLQSTQDPYTLSSLVLKAHFWANDSKDMSKLKSQLFYPGLQDLTKSVIQGKF